MYLKYEEQWCNINPARQYTCWRLIAAHLFFSLFRVFMCAGKLNELLIFSWYIIIEIYFLVFYVIYCVKWEKIEKMVKIYCSIGFYGKNSLLMEFIEKK